MSECRSCHAPIEWAVTDSGKRIPLDMDPAPDGNLEPINKLPDGTLVVAVVPLAAAIPAHDDRRISHFVTCPQADNWRRPR